MHFYYFDFRIEHTINYVKKWVAIGKRLKTLIQRMEKQKIVL